VRGAADALKKDFRPAPYQFLDAVVRREGSVEDEAPDGGVEGGGDDGRSPGRHGDRPEGREAGPDRPAEDEVEDGDEERPQARDPHDAGGQDDRDREPDGRALPGAGLPGEDEGLRQDAVG
jgi:hypothetical protein